jgi:hypothetical protein
LGESGLHRAAHRLADLKFYVALPCNVAGIIAIVLLLMDPVGNLPLALWLLIPMVAVWYGTGRRASIPSTEVHASDTR